MANTIDYKDKILMNGVGMDIASAIWGVRAAIMGERAQAYDWYKVQSDIDAGLGPINYPVGSLLHVSHETGITAAVSGSGITAAAVDEDTFIEATGHTGSAVYEYVYDGSVWKHEDKEVLLSEFGITVTGTPAEGDTIIVTELDEKLPFLVVDSDEDYVDLLMAYGINGRPVDGAEAFYTAEDGTTLTAGKYYLEVTAAVGNIPAGSFAVFTLASAVDVGHQLAGFEAYTDTAVGNYKVSHYSGPLSTDLVETVAVSIETSAPSDGTRLGTLVIAGDGTVINCSQRVGYGSNHWGESNVRQWLNSDLAAGEWYKQTHKWDRLASAYNTLPGFMRHLDPAFVAVIAEIENTNAYNTVYNVDGSTSGSYTTKDKFWLPSMTQLGYGNNNSIAEGTVWPYFDGLDNLDKRVFDITNHSTARNRWTRSCNP